MEKTAIVAAGLAFCLAALAAPAAPAEMHAEQIATTFTIHIKNFMYRPTPLTVQVGDRVTFINDDDEAHTVTSDDKSFDSEGLDSGGRWVHAFTTPGTYHYFCELHPYMKATIVVLPGASGSRRDGPAK